MGLLRLAVCVSGVYAAFLFWAIAQERRESLWARQDTDLFADV